MSLYVVPLLMIRILLGITCILLLFSQAIADETGDATSTVQIGESNLTNSTVNESQQNLQTTNLKSQSLNKDKVAASADEGASSITPSPTVKAASQFKESVGSVYDSDYTEPQPMTFTSGPNC